MQKSSIKYILKLSIPIFFANLAVPLVGIIDTSLMGNLEESILFISNINCSKFIFNDFLEFWFFKNGNRWNGF
jgi:MATE family multidrug resistance protein